MSSSGSTPCRICQTHHEIPVPSNQAALMLLIDRYRTADSTDAAHEIRASIDCAVATLAAEANELRMEQHAFIKAREEEHAARDTERKHNVEQLDLLRVEVQIANERYANEKLQRESAAELHDALKEEHAAWHTERQHDAAQLDLLRVELRIANDRFENQREWRETAEKHHGALEASYLKIAAVTAIDTKRMIAALQRERDAISIKLRVAEVDARRWKAANQGEIKRLTDSNDRLVAEVRQLRAASKEAPVSERAEETKLKSECSDEATIGPTIPTQTPIIPATSPTMPPGLYPPISPSPRPSGPRKLDCVTCCKLGRDCDGAHPCAYCVGIGDAQKCRYELCKQHRKLANGSREFGCTKERCVAVHSELGYGWDLQIGNAARRKAASLDRGGEEVGGGVVAGKRKRGL